MIDRKYIIREIAIAICQKRCAEDGRDGFRFWRVRWQDEQPGLCACIVYTTLEPRGDMYLESHYTIIEADLEKYVDEHHELVDNWMIKLLEKSKEEVLT